MITINIIIATTFRLLFYCHYCVSTRKLERAVKLFTPHLCKKTKKLIALAMEAHVDTMWTSVHYFE